MVPEDLMTTLVSIVFNCAKQFLAPQVVCLWFGTHSISALTHLATCYKRALCFRPSVVEVLRIKFYHFAFDHPDQFLAPEGMCLCLGMQIVGAEFDCVPSHNHILCEATNWSEWLYTISEWPSRILNTQVHLAAVTKLWHNSSVEACLC